MTLSSWFKLFTVEIKALAPGQRFFYINYTNEDINMVVCNICYKIF